MERTGFIEVMITQKGGGVNGEGKGEMEKRKGMS